MSTKTQAGREARESVLTFLVDFRRESGYFPTQQEIEEGLGMTRGPVLWHLKQLREQGFITYEPGRFSRTLRVTRKNRESLE